MNGSAVAGAGVVGLGLLLGITALVRGRSAARPPVRRVPSSPPSSPRQARPGSAAGLLLRAVQEGAEEAPRWVEVPWAGLLVRVGETTLRAPAGGHLLRLPVSHTEALEIARRRGWVLPTAELSDAIWRAASVRVLPMSLLTRQSDSRKMLSLEWVAQHDANVERGRAGRRGLSGDEGKDWILSERLMLRAQNGGPPAVNYGWRQPDGRPLQGLGPSDRLTPHDAAHADYSQVLRPIQRYATDAAAHRVDLLDVYERRGLPRSVTALLR